MSGEKLEELNLTLVIQREETPPPLTPKITPSWKCRVVTFVARHVHNRRETRVRVRDEQDKVRTHRRKQSQLAKLPPPPSRQKTDTIPTDGNKGQPTTILHSNTRCLIQTGRNM